MTAKLVSFINWVLTPLPCWIQHHEAWTPEGWIEQPGYYLGWMDPDGMTEWFRRWRIPLRVEQPCTWKYHPDTGLIIFNQSWHTLTLDFRK